MTGLHLAAEGGHYECIRLLLESGCNINELTNVSTHSAALYQDYLHTFTFYCNNSLINSLLWYFIVI